jgi:uncharacterized lipoprotein
MKILNKLGLFPLAVMLVACGGETLIADRYSLEYLDARTGKTLVYPAGIDVPEQSLEYDIPALSSRAAAAQDYDINQVVKPPRIVPLPKDETDEDKAESGQGNKRKVTGHAKRKSSKPFVKGG